MKSILHHLSLVPVITVVWVILEEELSVQTVLTGAVLGFLTLLIVDRYVLRGDYEKLYSMSVATVISYPVALVVQIYIAGFHALHRLVIGRTNVDVVEITTTLDDDFRIALLANSITLTPGTVTVERNGDRLNVIWLDCVTTDPVKAGPMIKLSFERMLAGGRS
jgi:multicomponent Na+:H+ antiporter subunit E